MTPECLHDIMAKLAHSNPIYKNEKEFQEKLGKELIDNGYKVVLEKGFKITCNEKYIRIKLDILAIKEGLTTAIEVKYKAHQVEVVHNGGIYPSKDKDWGTNMPRFYILKDLHRVGLLVAQKRAHFGYSISIVNVPDAWERDTSGTQNAAKQFSIHAGRTLNEGAKLNWSRIMKKGSVTAAGMPPHVPIVVPCDQTICWRPYSRFPDVENGIFQYTLMAAQSSAGTASTTKRPPNAPAGKTGREIVKAPANKLKVEAPPEVSTVSKSQEILPVERTRNAQNLRPKPLICISGNAKDFWGLRLSCSQGRADGGNHYGNVSKATRGASGIITLKQAAITNIALRGGNFAGIGGYQLGPSWTAGGNDCVGHAPFPTVEAAFRYLEVNFRLCACPDAVLSLRAHGVTFIQPCDKSAPSTEIVEI